jgi:hypothetical protein
MINTNLEIMVEILASVILGDISLGKIITILKKKLKNLR